MWDQSQIRYIQEVLGVALSPGVTFEAEPLPVHELLVLTPRLSADESALLTKILTSAKLPPHRHVEVEIFSGHQAGHVIAFDGGSTVQQEGSSKIWHLPELKAMLGSSVQVTGLKRITWTLLQQLSQELQ